MPPLTEPSGISVVIPTRGDPASVARLLASLARSAKELPPQVDHEVIVVDDTPQPELREIRQVCADHGARYLAGPRRVGAKRNAGVSRSRHPLILFIDSDCVATPDLLRHHLDAHRAEVAPSGRPVGAVAGPTLVVEPDESPAWRTVKHSVVVNSPWLWPQRFAEVWWAATSNLSVRRDAFEAIGGFDPDTYTVVGGEDVDLGVRLHASGYATVCRPEAVVGHATDGITSIRQFQRKMLLYGRACVYNCARQPEHARWSANPVSLLGLLWAVSLPVRRGALVGALGTAAALAWFGAQAARSAGDHGTSLIEGVRATSVDWCFHLGITREALARKRPALAFRRFDYFRAGNFIPLPADAETTGKDTDE
ncbi:glycosyltransferase family 2 protein [Actinokineospora fastidiosa]|uniref:Glycosyltransferase n=1 Tax=Actinokineospora fastidiosa TaxID=1816 RepID=A0A918LGQ1_9PSEU|nr:glycosyltransferase [Actinokineospora fastidiosa]GGS45039.1 hypothetical protein GCM10010171_44970 [Actinokineospora fastidiosa]